MSHQMHLIKTHPTKAEQWDCRICGRSFVMQWPPSYKRIILAEGDENIDHSIAKGNIQLDSITLGELAKTVKQ